MSKTVIQILLGLLFVGLCFAVGAFLAKRKSKKAKVRKSRPADTLPLSAFSTLDHPAGRQEANEINPLAEAEVFMIYGKKEKAQEVLKEGVAQGSISPEEVGLFWAKYNPGSE